MLVTKEFDGEEYDKNLRKRVKLGEPSYIEISKSKEEPEPKVHMKDGIIVNEAIYWGMDSLSHDYRYI